MTRDSRPSPVRGETHSGSGSEASRAAVRDSAIAPMTMPDTPTKPILPLARDLGRLVDAGTEIPALEPIPTHTFRLTNWLAWGFASKAEMERAWYGDEA